MTQDEIIELAMANGISIDEHGFVLGGEVTIEDIVKFVEIIQIQAQPISQDAADAERYRWLKPNYAMANFDIYDAEKGESKQSGIIFEMPDCLSYGADLDALIDAAMKESK